ncbi:tyrosine-type recombinase/integrase [Citrobacter braakii]|uniref:Recombinase XerD n=1 Tax=Citrobacter braakii TaxID=57706 RepID=A0A1V8P0W4_CITBR|nr:site-specific integrase [Citrobacter braakii]OQM42233.1 recombinase XerD [Citrobacter braakii]QXC16915.1 site-specific integrase [Citrobacter braakii]
MKEKITWTEFVEEYILEKELRTASEWSYRKVSSCFAEHLGPFVFPEDVTRRHALLWRRRVLKVEKRQETTWNNKASHMNALFNYAIKRRLFEIDENPFAETKVKAGKKKKKTMRQAQISHAYRVMEAHEEEERRLGILASRNALFPAWFWLTMMDTLYYTGMRQNQLLHLRVGDIFLDENIIRLGNKGSKNHQEHFLSVVSYLKPRLALILQKAAERGLKKNDLLFNIPVFTGKDENITEDMGSPPVRSFFRRLSRECGFTMTSHRFRHTLATEMMKLPEQNLYITRNVLGHSSMKSTLEYVERDLDAERRVLEKQFAVLKKHKVIDHCDEDG